MVKSSVGMNMKQAKDIQISIIGGGLVGTLCACILAKKGVRVKIHEFRDDLRQQQIVSGRSINLSLSTRARAALRMAGLDEEVIERNSIPMRGRMLHTPDGQTIFLPYDKQGNCLYAVVRKYLNEALLTAAEKNPNIEIHFKSKFIDCDLKSGKYNVRSSNGNITEDVGDLLIGCDGAHSAVRQQMVKMPRFNYSQSYTDLGYVEIIIPATDSGKFAMGENYLHMWPRDSFIMVAFPNPDGSFTAVLVMPFTMFESIKTPEDLMKFANDNLKDVVPLIEREKFITQFFRMPPSAFVSVKCKPHHVEDKILLLGDAAHAMAPFYGQGINAGFEDCEILAELLEEHSYDFKKVLPAYTELRAKEMDGIVDLSIYRYVEIKQFLTFSNLLREKVDSILTSIFPKSWIPMYNMITFTKEKYSHCIRLKGAQDRILMILMCSAAFIGFSIIIALFTRTCI